MAHHADKPKPHSDETRELLHGIAARQYGVITLEQLRKAGIDKHGVRSRVRNGRLHRVHPGVYALGRPGLERHGLWLAAVLSHKLAVLSHRSAAELWALLPERPGPIHIAIPTGGGRDHRRGVRVHRLISLEEKQTTSRKRIPVTTVSRTIIDLERSGARNEARRARRQAEFLGFDYRVAADDRTASRLEAALLALCARSGIPLPEVNAPIGPYVADFLWRDAHLVVETDGWGAHRGQSAFEHDRGRDLHLSRLGFRVHRFSWRQVAEDAQEIASLLRHELGLVG
jgi:hypothetical protein